MLIKEKTDTVRFNVLRRSIPGAAPERLRRLMFGFSKSFPNLHEKGLDGRDHPHTGPMRKVIPQYTIPLQSANNQQK